MADAERSKAMQGNQNAKKDGNPKAKSEYRYSVGGFFATKKKQAELDARAKSEKMVKGEADSFVAMYKEELATVNETLAKKAVKPGDRPSLLSEENWKEKALDRFLSPINKDAEARVKADDKKLESQLAAYEKQQAEYRALTEAQRKAKFLKPLFEQDLKRATEYQKGIDSKIKAAEDYKKVSDTSAYAKAYAKQQAETLKKYLKK